MCYYLLYGKIALFLGVNLFYERTYSKSSSEASRNSGKFKFKLILNISATLNALLFDKIALFLGVYLSYKRTNNKSSSKASKNSSNI